MKIYIGASSQDVDRARCMANTCHVRGMQVVSTWIDDISLTREPNSEQISHCERFSLAYRDMKELATADWLWMLMPPPNHPSMGAFWEYGYAYASGINTCISGTQQYKSVFTAMSSMRFDRDDEALEFFSHLSTKV
jgi:nucleoside 2-deoxyribosyltransferase